jgi:hypothetical protein
MSEPNARKIAAAFRKYGFENCQLCWELNRLHGEGRTMQAYATCLHPNSTGAAKNAYHAWLILANYPHTPLTYTRPISTR